MRPSLAVLTVAACCLLPSGTADASKVVAHTWTDSEVFPGTNRHYWVYLPDAALRGRRGPFALAVFQDGQWMVAPRSPFKTQQVFDQLIAAGEMPPTVGVFINPGHTGPLEEVERRGKDRVKPKNRSFEYDSLGDQYVTFLLDEILPAVERDHRVKLTDDPALRLIGGVSSGGICAFTAAWERPDAFGKVVSNIGSFVDIRGGHAYPPLIRKSERRPIRVHLTDNPDDLDVRAGNWWLANLQMKKALAYRGYDFEFVEAGSGHSSSVAASKFPDTLRWMFRDWRSDPAADPIKDPHPID
ncbi:MAG: alpha/beta hydrolase-fold protein [Planctomycetota bacterium]